MWLLVVHVKRFFWTRSCDPLPHRYRRFRNDYWLMSCAPVTVRAPYNENGKRQPWCISKLAPNVHDGANSGRCRNVSACALASCTIPAIPNSSGSPSAPGPCLRRSPDVPPRTSRVGRKGDRVGAGDSAPTRSVLRRMFSVSGHGTENHRRTTSADSLLAMPQPAR